VVLASASVLTRLKVDGRIFASSINFDIELQTITLGQLTHARALNGADMHESVRLAVIARDKAEALHRVEKLNRTRSLFAGQLALGCGWRLTLGNGDHIADHDQVTGGNLAATINQRELQPLTFGQTFQASALNSADVHKHILATVFTLNKAEAFLHVEKLHDTFALAYDLSWHAGTGTTGATRATAKAATPTTRAAAAETVTTTEAIATTTAETILTSTHERIEAFLAEPVALVPASTATPSVKTHKPEITFVPPD